MPRRLPLLAGILVAATLAAACGDDSTPTTPTPTPTPPPVATPPPAPPPPPPEPAGLASVSINPATVGSQNNAEGTVTLTAAAPTGGAVIRLESGNPAVARVPENATVAAGATTATFRIETSTVNTSSTVTIIASYSGVSRNAQLTVQPPTLEPRFTVSSARGTDTCDIINALGAFDCRFDASPSSGFPGRYHWSMRVGTSDLAFTAADNEPVVTPGTTCGFLGNTSQNDGRIEMEVGLQLEDRAGNRSGTTRRTITIYHNGRCGY